MTAGNTGKHHKRDHVSFILLPDGQVVEGLAMWQHFKDIAEANTAEKWKMAHTKIASLHPKPKTKAPAKKARRNRSSEAGTNAPRDIPEPQRYVSYTGWSLERLSTEPLKRGERREREKALVRAVVEKGGSYQDAVDAVARLYLVAAGNSADLASRPRAAELLAAIPSMVERLSRCLAYRWATTEEAERVRKLLIARVEKLEAAGVPGWSVERFSRWLDGFYAYAGQRAENGGYTYLANTIVRALRTDDSQEYVLRDNGGSYRAVYLAEEFCAQYREYINRRADSPINLRPRSVTAYLAYVYVLLTTVIDDAGQTAVRLVQSAKRGTINGKRSWCLDLTALPLKQCISSMHTDVGLSGGTGVT